MGSSSSSRSGRDSSSRHSATRRRSPPESGRDVGVARRQAQRVHGDLDRALEVPRAGGLDLLLELGLLLAELLVVGVGVGPLGQDLVVALEQRGGLAEAVHHVADDVLVGIEVGLLLEQADGEARA